MNKSWHELTVLTQGEALRVERVRIVERDVAVEGSFDLPPLAQLTEEEQVFITAFVRSHGSIKEMERIFGISYPTVKNRLNRIAERLEPVEVAPAPRSEKVLDRLERGEIDAQEAIRLLTSEGGSSQS